MRISHLIIIGVAAFGAMLVVGCSKSSSPPTVRFLGYKVGSDGTINAAVEMHNPNQSPIVCQLEIQPRDPALAGGRDFVITAKGQVNAQMYVSNTNALSLSVTVFRTVPIQHLTVPMQ
jgi:hypothetical protein